MSETSIQTATESRSNVPPTAPAVASAAVPAVPPASRPRHKIERVPFRVLKFLASLRLTVVLFVLSIVLVFVGTLAQMDDNIHGVVTRYFRSFYVWVPFQLFLRFCMVFFGVDRTAHLSGAFPFPGGWTLGTALLINLLAAHLTRFKISWKRSGILLIHSGLVLMMLGELWTGVFAVEGHMTIQEGQNANYAENRDYKELAFISSAGEGKEDQVVVPDSKLRPGTTISDPQLPVDIEVLHYYPNSSLSAVKGSDLARILGNEGIKIVNAIPDELGSLVDAGLGKEVFAEPKPREVGVSADKPDFPSAYVTFKEKDSGKSLGTYFVSAWLSVGDFGTQRLTVDGKTYEVFLRFKRAYKPYTVYLSKVKTAYYPNTEIPKSYSSVIRLQDPNQGEDIRFKIYMNQPLRYQGETFYQAGVHGGDTTILQVVKNQSWWAPYISCVVVGLGMLIHFMLNLVTFLNIRGSWPRWLGTLIRALRGASAIS